MKVVPLRCRVWALAAAVLAGCAAQSPSQVPPVLTPTIVRDARALPFYVYAGECCRYASSGGDVTVYDLGLSGVALKITKGITSPDFMTVDRSGRLYVINRYWNSVVTEYDHGAKSPSRSFKLTNAYAATTDSSNNLYVALCPSCTPYGSGKGSVEVYEAGTMKRLRTITDGIDVPLSVAIDAKGNLYVADAAYSDSSIGVYAPGASKPLRKLTRGLKSPSQVTLDTSNNVYVLNNPVTGSQSVVEFEADSNKLLRTITNGVRSPQAIATDSTGTLYVAANGGDHGWIAVYPPGATTPSYEITHGANDPISLTVDAQDDLYVANHGQNSPIHERRAVCVYAPNTKKPLRCASVPRLYDLPTQLASGR